VKKISRQFPKEHGVTELHEAPVLPVVKGSLEIRREIAELGNLCHGRHQRVLVGLIDLGERANQITDISANAEVRYAASIEDDPERHGESMASG
jgi:hypothetical protein